MKFVRIVLCSLIAFMVTVHLHADKKTKALSAYKDCADLASEAVRKYHADLSPQYRAWTKVRDLQEAAETLLSNGDWKSAQETASSCAREGRSLIQSLRMRARDLLLGQLTELEERRRECATMVDPDRYPLDAAIEQNLFDFIIREYAPLVHTIAGHPEFDCLAESPFPDVPPACGPVSAEGTRSIGGPPVPSLPSMPDLLQPDWIRLPADYACITDRGRGPAQPEGVTADHPARDRPGPAIPLPDLVYGPWGDLLRAQLERISVICSFEDPCWDPFKRAGNADAMGQADKALRLFCEISSMACRGEDRSRQVRDKIDDYIALAERQLDSFKAKNQVCEPTDAETRQLSTFLKGISACGEDVHALWLRKINEAKKMPPECRCQKKAIEISTKMLESSLLGCDHAAALAQWGKIEALLGDCPDPVASAARKHWEALRASLSACAGPDLVARITRDIRSGRLPEAGALLDNFPPSGDLKKQWLGLRAEYDQARRLAQAKEDLQSALQQKDDRRIASILSPLADSEIKDLWEAYCSMGREATAKQLARKAGVRKPKTALPAECPAPPAIPPAPGASPAGFLSLDVWQSAWNDFSGLSSLFQYLKASGIRSVNLNPGLPMGPKFDAESYRLFAPLAMKFKKAGIQVAFLYAELGYPIGYFAEFLRAHQDEFQIDTILDDSEFVDAFADSFSRNLTAVRQAGIRYSAFVTLESPGNSGVSDKTRHWVLEHVDEPILMSYFSCDLAEQKRRVGPYLDYADTLGKLGSVKIAILMGGKSVGRETSCERLLGADDFLTYIRGLHAWAQSHPSYGGIVIETNERMPRYPVGPLTP